MIKSYIQVIGITAANNTQIENTVKGEITMKQYTILLSLLLLCCFLTTIVSADPAIIISNYTLSPEVLFPGDTAELQFTLTNAETANTIQTTSTSGGVTTITTNMVGATIDRVWLLPAYDGKLRIRSLQTFTPIGDLAPGSSMPLTMQIIADENISTGTYFPSIAINVDSYQNVRYPIPIKICNETVDILPSNIPSKISVGGETPITLTIVNNRESTLTNVMLEATNDDELTISPSTIALGLLTPGQTQEVTVSLKPKQTGKSYLNFTVFFKNGPNPHIKTFEFPVEVIQTLDVAAVFYGDILTIPAGGNSRTRLEIYNAKTTEISGVIVTPITDIHMSPSQFFIGSMDPDDVFSVTFDVFAGTLSPGNYSIGFQVSFKQGEEYFESPITYRPMQITAVEEKPIIRQPSIILGGIILFLCIIFLVVFLILKKRRSR